MDILGIGPLELIVVLIIALAVFGPDRLPQVGAKMGRMMKDMRRATREFSREIDEARAAIEAPAKEIAQPFQEAGTSLKEVASAAQAFRNPGQALRESIMSELSAADSPAETASAAPAEAAAAAPTGETMQAAPADEPENRIVPPGVVPNAEAADPAPPPSDAEAAREPQQASPDAEA